MNFQTGQKVVCVRPVQPNGGCGDEILPEVQAAYTVRQTAMFHGRQFVRLCEIKNPVHMYAIGMCECWFMSEAFRRAIERKTDISIFTEILDDVRAGKVREIALTSR